MKKNTETRLTSKWGETCARTQLPPPRGHSPRPSPGTRAPPEGTRPGRGRQCSESPPIEPPYCLSLRFKTHFSTCKRTYRSHGKGFKTGRRLWPPSAARPDPHPRAALLPRARPVASWHAVEGDHCQRRRRPAEQPVRRVPSRAAGPRSPPRARAQCPAQASGSPREAGRRPQLTPAPRPPPRAPRHAELTVEDEAWATEGAARLS